MRSPRRHVRGVECCRDDVVQVRVEQPAVVRQRNDLRNVGVAIQRRIRGTRPGKIHVPEKRQRFSVFGPEVEDEIVRVTLAVSVHITAERFHRC